jgi:lysophospholipase L1-like esterase
VRNKRIVRLVTIGLGIGLLSIGSSPSVPAATAVTRSQATKAQARKPKAIVVRAPKEVLVGQPFSVSARNIKPGAFAAFDTQDVTLGWVKADANGIATVTSSLWREQTTRLTVTEIVNGNKTRKVTTSLSVLAAVFTPQPTPTAPATPADANTAMPGATVVAPNPCRAQDAPIRIWPLGDSLTVGGYGDPVGFTDSYRYSLFRSLRSAGNTDVVFRGHIGAPGSPLQWGAIAPAESPGEFSHSGLGGFTVAMITNDLQYMASFALPDVVIVNLGTNGGTPDEYRGLIAKIEQLAPNAIIVMGTLTPRVPELTSRKAVGFRAELNATISALGNTSTTDRLYTADVFNRMFSTDGSPLTPADFADETHLSVSGGTRFAQALFPEVRQAVAAFRVAPCR